MKTNFIYSFLMILILLHPFVVASSTIHAPATLDVGSCQLFTDDNFWNIPIDSLPVHPNSAQWINSIGTSDTFHMDFGSGTWDGGPIGIPYNVISGSTVNKYNFDFYYPEESDAGPYPLPTAPQIEWGSDHHILTVDTDDCTLYELYDVSYANGQWNGGSGAIWDLNSNNLRPDTWTSADAAGLPILPGLARYDEVASGIIEHALRFTANCTANYYIWPARHEAQHGSCTTPAPFGSRFRLKANYNISGFSSQAQVLLQSFKTYGIVLADNGSDWYVSGAPSPSWNNNQLHELDVLKGSDFEAVDTAGLMVDYNSGATSNTYTISGNVGMAGATLSYIDGIAQTATADGSGNYTFSVPRNWAGTVTPLMAGYTFSPRNIPYTNLAANQVAQNYTAWLAIPSARGGDSAGVFRPSNGLLYLKNANTSGFADIAINYGTAGDYPVAGDWDGNGTATIGIYRNGSFYLRNSNTLGFADLVFAFGTPGDQPIAGDWDGNGTDTIGVFRPTTGQFLLRNTNSAGAADASFFLGNAGDVGIAGDWNGDDLDTTGVFRPSNGVIFMKNANTSGFADIAINYGLAGDKPVIGDWDNDGIDSIGVYRNGQFLLRNSNTLGFADIVFALGVPGDMPIAGNWDGLP